MQSKQKFQWYLNRLQAMSIEEAIERGKLSLKKRVWRRRQVWIAPEPEFNQEDPWCLQPLPQDAFLELQTLLNEANCYLEGKYTLLNFSFEEPEINWHRDPQTDRYAPLEFGLTLDYRNPSLVGNVKNTWEKNRHHHLSVIALAYALTDDERYAIAVEKQLNAWVEQNPFPLGVNWSSSLELGIRLIAWVWIERLLRKSPVHLRLFGKGGTLWSSIYWHQWLIAQHYSQGSSANNHIIGEMSGLFIAASLWSVFPESGQWRWLARNMLEREVSRQTFSSGLNREQAFSYHIFSLEFFLLAGLEAERLGVPFSPAYQDWVRRMLAAIPPLVDVGGNLPQYGDSDEGMALQLRPLNSSRLDWLFRLGHQWLGVPGSQSFESEGVLATTLIGIDKGEEPAKPGSAPQHSSGYSQQVQNSVEFDDAGLFVLACNRGQPDEVFCLADAGCLGYLSIAAHGHADILSFTLNVGGVPVIVDPGTYTYHADPLGREYFRSTKAHNTVVVDGHDQSEPAGAFLWKKKAQPKVLLWKKTSQGGVLVAEHDGYKRLLKKVVHRRRLALEDKQLEVNDQLFGDGIHSLEWRLHFSPECKVNLQEDRCQIIWPQGGLEIDLDRQIQWTLSRGAQEAGWYSSGFNLKEATYTLIGSAQTQTPVTLTNVMRITD